jgi:hypothetical protein
MKPKYFRINSKGAIRRKPWAVFTTVYFQARVVLGRPCQLSLIFESKTEAKPGKNIFQVLYFRVG